MGDLINDWPSWGQTGEYPVDGFFYDGGDQVNEKHFDALWNGLDVHVSNINTAIRTRVDDLAGNVVLDQGLVASAGSGTREVDVSASNDGAYVDGEPTGSIGSTTLSHTAGGPRTDVVYVDKDGNISKDEGSTSVPNNELKIAEVDIDVADTIDSIRNYARDHTYAVASENSPSNPEPGDFWYDLDNDELYVYDGASWVKHLSDADTSIIAGDGLKAGSGLTINIEPTDFAGHGLEDDGSDNLRIDSADLGVGISGGDGTDLSLDESVIKDGGAKEVDAAELDGSSGTAGKVLRTDGSSVSWDTPTSALFGSGSDGAITDSTNTTRDGTLETTTYELQAGNTVTVGSGGMLLISATDKITINGTIDATGVGASGGSSGGGAGTNADILPEGTGGAGGDSLGATAVEGGDGGDGDTRTITSIDKTASGPMAVITDFQTVCSAGGGGGGDSNIEGTAVSGANAGGNGSPPGGGGEGALGEDGQGYTTASGGAGGDGGGIVILLAPEIEVGGTILADGADGADGNSADLGSGGGGGGSGGVIYLYSETLVENSPTYSASAGTGGVGGTGNNADGGDGASGASGLVVKA